MAELKPCPFCGGEAKRCFTVAGRTVTSNVKGAKLWGLVADLQIIQCTRCGAQTKPYKTDRVFAAWNRRADNEVG